MKQIEVVNKGTNAETAIRFAPVHETAIRLAPVSEIAERLNRIEGSLKRTAGRIGRMENSFSALVDRLNRLEKDTHTHTMYSGTAVPITKEDAEGGSW